MTQVHFYDQTCVHVDGYKNIIRFDSSQVLLCCRKGNLVICGSLLHIASFNREEITIVGNIFSVHWEMEGEMLHE